MRNPAYCLQCDDGTLLEHATRDMVFSYCGRSFSAHNVLLLTLRRCVRPPFCFLAVPVWSLAKIFSHATAQRRNVKAVVRRITFQIESLAALPLWARFFVAISSIGTLPNKERVSAILIASKMVALTITQRLNGWRL